MHQRPEPILPDPWHDPEFSRRGAITNQRAVQHQATPTGARRRGAFLGRSGTQTGILALVLAAVWLGLLLDPMFGPIMLSLLMALGLTLAVVVTAMGLGWMGIGLFAAGDRVIAWFREGTDWPED